MVIFIWRTCWPTTMASGGLGPGCARRDPMVDVARVLASLRVSSLRVHGRLGGFVREEEGFLRSDLDVTAGDERRARWFER
jgi:hypothetical protein